MKNILILFFILMFFSSSNLYAQETESEYHHSFLIMGVPQHLFQNGIRIEFDRRLNNPQNWLIVAPTLYYRGHRGNWLIGNFNVHSMWGAGLEVFYRRFLKDQPEPDGFYVSGGTGYRFVSQEYRGDRWDVYTENGHTFYRYNNSSWHKQNHTFSIKGTAGYQFVTETHLMLDVFIGFGLLLSMQDIPDNVEVLSHYDNDAFNFGYTGLLFVSGFRLGIGW